MRETDHRRGWILGLPWPGWVGFVLWVVWILTRKRGPDEWWGYLIAGLAVAFMLWGAATRRALNWQMLAGFVALVTWAFTPRLEHDTWWHWALIAASLVFLLWGAFIQWKKERALASGPGTR